VIRGVKVAKLISKAWPTGRTDLDGEPSLKSSLVKHLNGKAARTGEVERPRPVHVPGLSGVHSCRLQPIVDVIHLVVRILHEANVLDDLVRLVEIADGEHETGVVGQYDIGVGRFSDAVDASQKSLRSPIHRRREG
jgi:hypothetical protein